MTAKNIIHDVTFLSKKSQAATKADLPNATDLRDTLMANQGRAAGLAANMIGVDKQIIAFFVGPLPVVMLNPIITSKSGLYTASEGCLSLTGERPAKRYREITVQYDNLNFEKQTQTFTDFTAEVIQHEIDHCHGILI
ncbi:MULTISPECIES: peptide deformylase [Lactobacillus]|uniref:Peptide deformylase n=1 Tax=Lactobacillus xujianguonis TaxID=2495899 RepID=A0A437SX17_9LACO|nr:MULTISPECIES: peptide deformylase [Lactobacillus]RVU71459.1 peptide deformylase [Lactobacillus xujianguonis]RVU73682.1 peptide deformylase [Lactobacillus xujianguonis]